MTARERALRNIHMPTWYIVGEKLFFTEQAAQAWRREVDYSPIKVVQSTAYKQRIERERLRGKK